MTWCQACCSKWNVITIYSIFPRKITITANFVGWMIHLCERWLKLLKSYSKNIFTMLCLVWYKSIVMNHTVRFKVSTQENCLQKEVPLIFTELILGSAIIFSNQILCQFFLLIFSYLWQCCIRLRLIEIQCSENKWLKRKTHLLDYFPPFRWTKIETCYNLRACQPKYKEGYQLVKISIHVSSVDIHTDGNQAHHLTYWTEHKKNFK